MPVKNAEPFLLECLGSILKQTFPDWELIVVEDHSTDNSLEMLQEYAHSESKINLYQNRQSGIISALQMGLEKCSGSYITRMDADDRMPADRLQKMYMAIAGKKKKSIVTGLVKYFSDHPVSPGYQKYEKWLNRINIEGKQWENIYRECVIASPNWMVRKEDLVNIGGFNNLSYPEDYHMVLKWYQHGFSVFVVPGTTLYWREHPQRTSRNSENYGQEAFFDLKINTFIKHDLKSDNLVIWGDNEKTKLTAQILERRKIPFIHLKKSSFDEIERIHQLQLLVGVYPSRMERTKIEKYLQQLDFIEGIHWWYL